MHVCNALHLFLLVFKYFIRSLLLCLQNITNQTHLVLLLRQSKWIMGTNSRHLLKHFIFLRGLYLFLLFCFHFHLLNFCQISFLSMILFFLFFDFSWSHLGIRIWITTKKISHVSLIRWRFGFWGRLWLFLSSNLYFGFFRTFVKNVKITFNFAIFLPSENHDLNEGSSLDIGVCIVGICYMILPIICEIDLSKIKAST